MPAFPIQFRPWTALALAFAALLLVSCKSSRTGGAARGGSPSPLAQLSPEYRDRFTTLFVEASIKLSQDKREEALADYEAALRILPNHGPTLYQIGRIHLESEAHGQAEDFARRAVEADPNNVWYPRLQADALTRLNRPADAAAVLEAAARKFPDELDLKFQLSESLIASQQYDKALKLFDQLENQSGLYEAVMIQKKQVYQMMGRPDDAIAALQQLIDRSPGDPRYFYELHDLYLGAKRHDEARRTLEQLLVSHPDDPVGNFKVIDYMMMRGENAAALQRLRANIDRDRLPVQPKVEYLFRMLQSPQYFNDKVALVELSQLLDKRHPRTAMVYSLRGDLFATMGRSDSARYYYRESLRLDPSNEKAWEAVLLRDSELNLQDSLLSDSQKAIEHFPNNPTLLYFYGTANHTRGNYNEAIYALEKFLKYEAPMYFDPLQAVMTLADSYHRIGDHKSSDKYFDKALEISPGNPLTLNNYAYFLSLRRERLDAALKMIEQSIAREPNNSSFQDTYGWVLYELGRYEEARQWIEKAYNNKGSADVTHHLGDVYFRLGNTQRAVELWKEAREKGLKDAELDRKISTNQL